jgi:hypothetical protein
MSVLTKEDKLQLIDSRKKNLEYRKYSLELDLIVENAKTSSDAAAVEVIEDSIAEVDNQVSALNAELVTVNALAE